MAQIVALLVAVFITYGASFHLSLQRSCVSKKSLQRLLMGSEVEELDSKSLSLISTAQSFATTNLGISDSSILAESFTCSGPNFNNREKKSYLEILGKETAVFQRALPDFNLRPYSFSIDAFEPNTVWFKIRPKGTLTVSRSYTYLSVSLSVCDSISISFLSLNQTI
jgi:hypothetical protein